MSVKVWDPVEGRYRKPPLVREALLDMAQGWRSSAAGLQLEIDNGVALRQSIESKAGRVAVLESCADQVERFVKERWES